MGVSLKNWREEKRRVESDIKRMSLSLKDLHADIQILKWMVGAHMALTAALAAFTVWGIFAILRILSTLSG